MFLSLSLIHTFSTLLKSDKNARCGNNMTRTKNLPNLKFNKKLPKFLFSHTQKQRRERERERVEIFNSQAWQNLQDITQSPSHHYRNLHRTETWMAIESVVLPVLVSTILPRNIESIELNHSNVLWDGVSLLGCLVIARTGTTKIYVYWWRIRNRKNG